MTITSGLFNSINGDRKYKAENFADYFASFIGNGVFPNPSTGLKVVASSGLNVVVKPGKGWIYGYYVFNDADYTIKLANPDGVLSRIDRVVLRLDYINREIVVTVKRGTLASNPTPPDLQRDADAYELGLADIRVNNGSLNITNAEITDLRLNNNLCGIVSGLVNQVDTTDLYNQYSTYYNAFRTSSSTQFTNWMNSNTTTYNTWLNEVKTMLNSETAGNLLNQINAINNDTTRNPIHGRTTNSGNNYTITDTRSITAYVDDMLLVVTPNAKSTGFAYIRVNGLSYMPIYRSNGTQFKDFYADSKVTLRYSTAKSGFIVQGEGGGGTAVAADILTGKTATTDTGDATGTMPNRGAVSVSLNSGQSYTVPNGYHNGNGVVSVNTLAAQTQADAAANQILSGKTAWVNGNMITGNIPSQAAQTITPRTTNQTITSGRYLSGHQTILGAPTLLPENIKAGISIFGVAGTAPIAKIETSGTVNVPAYGEVRIDIPFEPTETSVGACRLSSDTGSGMAVAYANSTGYFSSRTGLLQANVSLAKSYFEGNIQIFKNHLSIKNESSRVVTVQYRVIQ